MVVIIDVREPQEYAAGHVEGAVNVPLQDLVNGSNIITDLEKNASIVLYCRSGNRSETARQVLYGAGFANVSNGINQHTVEKMLDAT